MPPPPPPNLPAESTNRPEGAAKNDRLPGNAAKVTPISPNLQFPTNARPLATEIGRASWYGPPYHNRRGSNGEVYNMHAMTAAHRTLPLGSIVRVTNLKTGHYVLVRITDRGPFIPGRLLDLSLAAARKLDVYLPGVAEVKVEVMQTPVPSRPVENGRCRLAASQTKIPLQPCRPSRPPLPHRESEALQQSVGRLVAASARAGRRSPARAETRR